MKRFRPAKTVDEERDSIEAAVPSGTKYCTKWAYKIFEDWQFSRKSKVAIEEATALRFDNLSSVQDLDSVKLEEFSVESLNFWLSKFVQEVAKKNGERYPPRSIYSIVSGINRYLAEANPNNSVNILNKAERRLTLFRKVLDGEMKDGTKEGLSVKFKKAERQEVTAEEEELFWSKGLLGNKTAECLLNTVYYYNGKLFGLRAKEHRQLRYMNIRVENNFIIFDESVSKTFHGGLNDLKYKPRFVKHFCHALRSQHSRCLVEIYELYLSMIQDLATKIDAFYFKPHRDPRVLGYEKVAIGINTLNKILPDKLCAAAGLAKKTSHCLRVTCATNLFENGVEEKIIRERTGHRSNALLRYEHPTEEQIAKASAALAPVDSSVIHSDLPAREWDLPEITDDMLKEIDACVLRAEGRQGEFNGDSFSEIPMLEPEAKANSSEMSNFMTNPCFNNCAITFNVNVGSKK